MQYQVPQFIDIEDKIIGPLTIKQFLFLAGGAVIIFVLIFLFKLALVIILGIPVLGVSIALAFGRIQGMTLSRYFLSLLKFSFKPQQYLWKKKEIKRPKKLN